MPTVPPDQFAECVFQFAYLAGSYVLFISAPATCVGAVRRSLIESRSRAGIPYLPIFARLGSQPTHRNRAPGEWKTDRDDFFGGVREGLEIMRMREHVWPREAHTQQPA